MPIFRSRRRAGSSDDGLTVADKVWNRATSPVEAPGRSGDVALASLLRIHNIAMNGGLLHSVEHHDREELAAGVAGYRYFGLDEAADVVGWVAAETDALGDDLDAAEALEVEADTRYGAVVPTDDVLVHAFESVFAGRPDEFAPVE